MTTKKAIAILQVLEKDLPLKASHTLANFAGTAAEEVDDPGIKARILGLSHALGNGPSQGLNEESIKVYGKQIEKLIEELAKMK